jgi:hypothetical protein
MTYLLFRIAHPVAGFDQSHVFLYFPRTRLSVQGSALLFVTNLSGFYGVDEKNGLDQPANGLDE